MRKRKVPGRVALLFCIGVMILVGIFALHLDIVTKVRMATAARSFKSGEGFLRRDRAKRGITPEWVEALSWMARGKLAEKELDKAEQDAKQTHELALAELKNRPLDAEPHLPIA